MASSATTTTGTAIAAARAPLDIPLFFDAGGEVDGDWVAVEEDDDPVDLVNEEDEVLEAPEVVAAPA